MKIKLINPNTTWSMTKSIENCAKKYANEGTAVYAVSPDIGVNSIECYVDEYLAIPGVLQEIVKGEEEGADAFVIACFGDPGLEAAREITDKPVVGIAEAAMATAKMIAPYFSIVSVLDRSVKITEDLVKGYGAKDFCKSIRSTGLSVLDFGTNIEKGLEALKEQSMIAVKEDGAECILLGCAGFVDFVEDLKQSLGVPVLDGVMPDVKFAEALVNMNLKTSKINTWGFPEEKEYIGYDLPSPQNR